jgi:uncharacterized membrane protein
MKGKNMKQPTFTCPVCNQQKTRAKGLSGNMVSTRMQAFIQEKFPHWDAETPLCLSCLETLRNEYFDKTLTTQQEEFARLRHKEAVRLSKHRKQVRDLSSMFESEPTLGERIADKMAEFGGSWAFIGLFCFSLIAWISINTFILLKHAFDPYPFILLNLFLSCIAAIQAPIIMMSQNRQEIRDRRRAEYDYKVNLRAELEIRHLHDKLDLLLTQHWEHLLEIQQLQSEKLDKLVQTAKGHELESH